jgi:hypothetical protein
VGLGFAVNPPHVREYLETQVKRIRNFIGVLWLLFLTGPYAHLANRIVDFAEFWKSKWYGTPRAFWLSIPVAFVAATFLGYKITKVFHEKLKIKNKDPKLSLESRHMEDILAKACQTLTALSMLVAFGVGVRKFYVLLKDFLAVTQLSKLVNDLSYEPKDKKINAMISDEYPGGPLPIEFIMGGCSNSYLKNWIAHSSTFESRIKRLTYFETAYQIQNDLYSLSQVVWPRNYDVVYENFCYLALNRFCTESPFKHKKREFISSNDQKKPLYTGLFGKSDINNNNNNNAACPPPSVLDGVQIVSSNSELDPPELSLEDAKTINDPEFEESVKDSVTVLFSNTGIIDEEDDNIIFFSKMFSKATACYKVVAANIRAHKYIYGSMCAALSAGVITGIMCYYFEVGTQIRDLLPNSQTIILESVLPSQDVKTYKVTLKTLKNKRAYVYFIESEPGLGALYDTLGGKIEGTYCVCKTILGKMTPTVVSDPSKKFLCKLTIKTEGLTVMKLRRKRNKNKDRENGSSETPDNSEDELDYEETHEAKFLTYTQNMDKFEDAKKRNDRERELSKTFYNTKSIPSEPIRKYDGSNVSDWLAIMEDEEEESLAPKPSEFTNMVPANVPVGTVPSVPLISTPITVSATLNVPVSSKPKLESAQKENVKNVNFVTPLTNNSDNNNNNTVKKGVKCSRCKEFLAVDSANNKKWCKQCFARRHITGRTTPIAYTEKEKTDVSSLTKQEIATITKQQKMAPLTFESRMPNSNPMPVELLNSAVVPLYNSDGFFVTSSTCIGPFMITTSHSMLNAQKENFDLFYKESGSLRKCVVKITPEVFESDLVAFVKPQNKKSLPHTIAGASYQTRGTVVGWYPVSETSLEEPKLCFVHSDLLGTYAGDSSYGCHFATTVKGVCGGPIIVNANNGCAVMGFHRAGTEVVGGQFIKITAAISALLGGGQGK